MHNKLQDLKTYFQNLGSAAIAFSGGVDSTFMLEVAHQALGSNVIAVTASSCFIPSQELKESADFCAQKGIKHIVFNIDPLKIPVVAENPKNRCYLCKKAIFQNILELAKENGIEYVCEGSNMDDLGDYRPGLLAIKELKIESPLRQVGLYKTEIRQLSKELKLPTWEKPSFACLASRFVYGEQLTEEKLKMVEKSEAYLQTLGFVQLRVRVHGNIARIEVPEEDFKMLLENHGQISEKLKSFGFAYVTMDLQGYRTGSMNETIKIN